METQVTLFHEEFENTKKSLEEMLQLTEWNDVLALACIPGQGYG